MPNTIRIKRSTGSTAPATLANAELAFAEGSQVLYIGVGTGGAGGSATTVNAIGGTGAYLALSGTQTASGTYTLSGTVNLSGTWQVAGVSVTADAAELNVLDGATAGSAVASKAVVLDASKDFDFGTGDIKCTDLTTSGNAVIGGNLTVNGTTTTINSTTVSTDDKNIVLADTASPTDASADDGGLTLRGTTDKTILWKDATDAWTFSEHVDLASAKAYYIAGASVLSASTLGAGVTASSLTSVGTIGTGTWQGTAVGVAYGGTGLTAAVNGLLKGNGSAYAAATAGTDYLDPSSTIDGGTF